jgi:protein SCO1
LPVRAYQILAGRAMNTRFFAPFALLLATAACGGGATPAEPPLVGARIGGPFALTDQQGRPRKATDFAGSYRILYFGYTYCPDVCPVDLANITAGLKAFEATDAARAARVVPIFITVDPKRDTVAAMKAFAANFHPRLVALTGPEPAIDAVAKAHAIYVRRGEPQPGGGYLVDHSRATYLMDPNGKPLALLPADQGGKQVAAALDQWVK